jgi:hypothetical protein
MELNANAAEFVPPAYASAEGQEQFAPSGYGYADPADDLAAQMHGLHVAPTAPSLQSGYSAETDDAGGMDEIGRYLLEEEIREFLASQRECTCGEWLRAAVCSRNRLPP